MRDMSNLDRDIQPAGVKAVIEKGGSMPKEHINIHDAIRFLNALVAVDRDAVAGLMRAQGHRRVGPGAGCLVQVEGYMAGSTITFLGILNALFGAEDDESGQITAVYRKSADPGSLGELSHFARIEYVRDCKHRCPTCGGRQETRTA